MAYKRKRSYQKKRSTKYRGRSRRTGNRAFQSRVRKVVMRAAETKYTTIGNENVQLYHDVGALAGPSTNQAAFLFNPWASVGKGTGRNQRIGNRLTPRGYSLRIWLANKADRPNLLYRVIVVILPRLVGTTAPSATNLDLFKACDVGTNNSTLTAEINVENAKKVLYDRIWSMERGSSNILPGTNKETHMLRKLWIKPKGSMNMIFDDAAGNNHQSNFIAFYCIPYDSYGTLQTDNVASMAFHLKLYWKDI